MLHQLLDQHLGEADGKGTNSVCSASSCPRAMRKAGKAVGGVFPSASSATAARIGEEAKTLSPHAVVDAMQFRHQPLYRLVGRQVWLRVSAWGWPSLPARRE